LKSGGRREDESVVLELGEDELVDTKRSATRFLRSLLITLLYPRLQRGEEG
jgi:hypothetical protein